MGQEARNGKITARVDDSNIIIQIINGYSSYVQFKFPVNIESVNGEPVN